MTNVIELAKQAGFISDLGCRSTASDELLERFAKLVRNAVLEEAAQKCVNYPEWAQWGQTDNYVKANVGAQDCAAAIRQLKDNT